MITSRGSGGLDDAHDHDAADADADALSWEGDEELGRSTSLTEPRPRRSEPDARGAAGSAAAGSAAAGESAAGESGVDDTPRRIATALFGVLYLAWTVGWILGIQIVGSLLGLTANPVLAFVDRIGQFLALVAAPLWFAGVLQLTSASSTRVRVGWFAVGAGLLIPWPVLLGVIA